MLSKLAFLLSILLHPLLLPSLAFSILLFYVSPLTFLSVAESYRWKLLFLIFILTFLAPLSGILLLYSTGWFPNLSLDARKDRVPAFFLTSVFYTFATALFAFGPGFKELPALAIIIGSISLSIVLVTVITLFWKISAHSTGISGLIGAFIALNLKFELHALLYPILLLIVLAGLLMSARLYLNVHTPRQLLVGALLGFSVNFSSLLFFI